MSFKTISATHSPLDKDYPARTHALNLYWSFLEGTFYDRLKHEWHEAFVGGQYVFALDRKPNIPTGTNELRIQTQRHVSMLFGASQFPSIETKDEATRQTLNDLIKECSFVERMREAALIGATGSVAIHMRALAPDGKPARIFFDVHRTAYFTPVFDPYRPNVLILLTEKRKVLGSEVAAMGYAVAKDDLESKFWFQRQWDGKSELWFVPWKVEEDGDTPPPAPVIDVKLTVHHNLGFVPWEWVKTSNIGQGIDGGCAFEAGIEHAIQLDYEDSQINTGIKYSMSPTMVIELPPVPANGMVDDTPTASDGGVPKTPETVLTTPAGGKVYYAELSGDMFKEAREKAKELRTSIIEAIHGDRVDPKEVTQAHQGAKSLEMLNQPMLMHIDSLRSIYEPAIKRLLKMVLKVVETRAVLVNDEPVDRSIANTTDLALRWGAYYSPTPADKLSEASAIDLLVKNGVLSRETATNGLASSYGIQNVPDERTRITAEQVVEDAREAKLARDSAVVQQKPAA